MKKLIKLIMVGATSLVALLAIKAVAADVPPYLHAVTKVSAATGAALRSMADEQLAAIEGGEDISGLVLLDGVVLFQTAPNNGAVVEQDGENNSAAITQVGHNNTAVITQISD